MSDDPVEELNIKIRELVEIARRRQDETLQEIVQASLDFDYPTVAVQALAYADWERARKGYLALLRESAPTLEVVRR